MRILDLFSGTGSVCATARALGHEVVSLDNALPADIECDVHEWDYTVYKPGHFDVVCASPPCAVWSNARLMNVGQFCKRTGGVWTKEMLEAELQGVHGALLVDRMRVILDYLQPTFYWIENPWLSRMRDYIVDLPWVCVDYCRYCDWGYRKRTRLWTNIEFNVLTCDGKGGCGNMEGKRHRVNLINRGGYLHEKYRVPPALVAALLAGCNTPQRTPLLRIPHAQEIEAE